MRASITRPARVMPEGVYRRALKAKAEIVEGELSDLLWDLNLYRYSLQRAVDALWELDKVPKKSQAHQLLYPVLKSYGFRAHVTRNIYSTALALVKSARQSKGAKPIVRRLSVRLDYQDARVDLCNHIVRVVLRNKWYALRIIHRREYIERFKDLRWKEVHLKYVGGALYVSIVFETVYKPYMPRGALALDVNLRHVVVYDGSGIRRYRTRFVGSLSKRARAEELTRKHPRRWRYSRRVLNRVKSLHRRARNIVVDWCRKFAKELVLRARRNSYAVVLEDLEYLHRSVARNGGSIAWKLSTFAYRKLQEAVITKAIEYNVPVAFVDPRNTSTTCPRCGAELHYIHRLAVCGNCGFKADRDSVGAINIWLRLLYAYAGELGSPPRAPAVKDEARRSGGTGMRGVKKVVITIHK